MTLKFKILVVLAGIMLLSAANGAWVLLSLSAQQPELEQMDGAAHRVADSAIPLLAAIKDIKVDVIQVQQWLTDISATRAQDGLNDGFDEAAEAAARFQDNVKAARQHAMALDMPDIVTALDRLEVDFPPYYQTGIRMAEGYIASGPSRGNELMGEFDSVAARMADGMDALTTLNENLISSELGTLLETSKGVKAGLTTILQVVIGLAIPTLLGGAIGGIAVYVIINRMIDALNTDVRTVEAHGDGPLRLEGRRDELGEVGAALAAFRERLRKAGRMESEQKAHEEQQAVERRQLLHRLADDLHEEVLAVANSISSAATSMQGNAARMSETANTTSQEASDVTTIAEDASHNVETVAAAAEELSASIQEISRQVADSARVAGEAVTTAAAATETVQGLAKAAGHISDIVAMITDIAAQTNLLALNATIEAARAGDAGKGFAVVANEVKNLANQTSRATEQISDQINSVQIETENAVSAIENVSAAIGGINAITSAIAAAVEEQGAATREIARNVQAASEATRQVSGTLGAFAAAANETRAAASSVLDACGDVSRQSETLVTRVDGAVERIRTS